MAKVRVNAAGAGLIEKAVKRLLSYSNTATKKVPTVHFSASRAPNIKANYDAAVRSGAPTRLTRTTARQTRRNRAQATGSYPSPRPKGQSVEEYPFASSAQGGAGATTRYVPKAEQDYQGGVLSAFYRRHGIKPGDDYNVNWIP